MLGSPIRKSPGQSVCAANRGLSQLATSFIALRRQGIHQSPLVRLIRSRIAVLLHAFRMNDACVTHWTLNYQRTKKFLVSLRSGFTVPRQREWWAQVDSNHRPPRYQHDALTS